MNPCATRSSFEPYVPTRLDRAIAARWQVWAPWVLMQQRRAPNYNSSAASAESARLRQRHSDHIIEMMRAGITMRTIRRHFNQLAMGGFSVACGCAHFCASLARA